MWIIPITYRLKYDLKDVELNNLLVLNIINSGISLIMGFYMFFFLQRNSFRLGAGYWATGSLVIRVGLSRMNGVIDIESHVGEGTKVESSPITLFFSINGEPGIFGT